MEFSGNFIIPTFGTGYALSSGDSRYPGLWKNLVGYWSPGLGKQGSTLYDVSGRKRNGTVSGVDPATQIVGGKFGYALSLDGTGDDVNFGTIDEFNGTYTALDMTWSFWCSLNTGQTGNRALLTYDANNNYSVTDDVLIYQNTGGTGYLNGWGQNSGWNLGIDLRLGRWAHYCITMRGTNVYFYLDGVLRHTQSITRNHNNFTSSYVFAFGKPGNMSRPICLLGDIGIWTRSFGGEEVRLLTRGASPLVPHSNINTCTWYDGTLDINETVVAEDTLLQDITAEITEGLSFSETNSEVEGLANDYSHNETEYVYVSDSTNIDVAINVIESVTASYTAVETIPVSFHNGLKVISYNPLLLISTQDPIRVIEVDISIPASPAFYQYFFSESGATDIWINETENYLYISCANGKLIKAQLDDLNTYSVLDVNDTDELMQVEGNEDNWISFASTNNSTAELYKIDNRTVEELSTRVDYLSNMIVPFDTYLTFIEGETISTRFDYLGSVESSINTKFYWLSDAPENTSPMPRTSVRVYLDNVELHANDIDLNSIVIRHSVGTDSTASFNLARRHDALNIDGAGNSRTITSKNQIRIEIDGNIEFDGKIGELDCRYDVSTELVSVTAYMTQPTTVKNDVTLPLPGLTERRNLYHIILQNPRMINPYLDENDTNPRYYNGVQVDLGEIREQQLEMTRLFGPLTPFSRVREFLDDVTFSTGAEKEAAFVNAVLSGEWRPKAGYTYFWHVTVDNYNIFSDAAEFNYRGLFTIDEEQSILNGETISRIKIEQPTIYNDLYIGTSPSQLNGPWSLYSIRYYAQKIKQESVTDVLSDYEPQEIPESGIIPVGYIERGGMAHKAYTLGSAPYKTITAKNGKYITKYRWQDNSDGLYLIRDAGYDYIDYAKEIARIEYEKLKTIGGTLFPLTSCDMNLTFDAYYFYNLNLLTRINISNTTVANIYNNSNGFPVSIKTIEINCSNMQVTLRTDNQLSQEELDELDEEKPDENDVLYRGRTLDELNYRPGYYEVGATGEYNFIGSTGYLGPMDAHSVRQSRKYIITTDGPRWAI